MMSTDDVPFCCGLMVIGEFPEYGTQYYDLDERPTLVERIKYIKESLGTRATIATLNTSQKKFWGRSLNACGFRQLKRFINTNTGNELFLFYRPEGRRKR